MAESTNISWCDATLNFWVGCTKVSTGPKGACEHCYAETWAKRWPAYRDTWGPGAPRVQFKHLMPKARKLEALAIAKLEAGGGAFFCFSNSLSDIFDNEVPIEWLAGAFEIMRATPHVTYLLLTKRPQNIVKRFRQTGSGDEALERQGDRLSAFWPKNAAIGCTVVTQKEAETNLPALLDAKYVLRPAFAFVSIEPMREAIDMLRSIGGTLWMGGDRGCAGTHSHDGNPGGHDHGPGTQRVYGNPRQPHHHHDERCHEGLDWVICGFESGPGAAPGHPEWARSLRDQCAAAGVPFQFKQWGAWHADALAFTDMHGRNPPPNMKVGPKRSGRLLDGVLHDARPVIA